MVLIGQRPKNEQEAHQNTTFMWYVAIFLVKFWAKHIKYGTFWRLAFIFYLGQDFNSYLKIMSGTWRLLEPYPEGQLGTYREFTFRYAFKYV